MSGGEPVEKSNAARLRGPPTDLEEALHKIDEIGDVEGVEEVEEVEEVEDTDEEGSKVRKEKETKAAAVLEKGNQHLG